MGNNIRITVKGTQKGPDGSSDSNSLTSDGMYFQRNGKHYVTVEDPQTKQNAKYKFNHRFLEVVRNNDLQSKLYYEAGKEYTSNYLTPYGRMLFTFCTDNYSIEETQSYIKVKLEYRIKSDGDVISENSTTVFVEFV